MALRTNNKQVNLFFDNEISNIIKYYFDNNIEKLQSQYVSSATDAKGRLYSVYCDKFQNYQDAFKEITYNYGDCYYDDMRNTLATALQETEEEKYKYENDQVANLYNCLMFRAYERAIKKAGFDISKGFKKSWEV